MAVDRALDDDAVDCPWSLWFAGMKAAYPSKFPSEIWAEVQRLPVGFLDEVVEAEAYMNARRIYKAAKSADDLPKDSPMIDLVRAVTFAQAHEAREKKRRG